MKLIRKRFSSIIFVSIVVCGCVSLETKSLVPLTDKYQTGTFNTVLIGEKKPSKIATNDKDELIADFNADIAKWYGCGDLKLIHDQNCLKMELVDARFQCIGYKFPELKDVTEKCVLKIRLKSTSSVFTGESIMFRVRFEDENGEETDDKTNIEMVVGGDFKDYYVDFTGKLKSSYSPFDGSAISKMKLFFNTKGNDLFTGTVFIDEVVLTTPK